MDLILLGQITQLGIGVVGLALTGLAIALFNRFRSQEKTVLVSFQLRPDETTTDFRLLLISNTIVMTAMTMYFFGAVLAEQTLMAVAGLTAMLFASTVMIIFYRWMKRI